MREMAMAHSLGFGALTLRPHWRDGSRGMPAAVPAYGSRRLSQGMVQLPRPNPVCAVHARQGSSHSRRVSEQDQAAVVAEIKPADARASSEYQTMSIPAETTLPPQQGYIGSPLLWVGVGVGISVLFSWAANYAKKQAMQQALKTMMAGTGTMPNSPATTPFPFPVPPQSPPASQSVTSQPTQKTVSSSPVEAPQPKSKAEAPAPVTEKPAFTDVEVEAEASTVEVTAEVPTDTQEQKDENKNTYFKDSEVKDTESAFSWNTDGATSTSSDAKTGFFSVETLEKMLDDPTVQQMVYPYLPEEMRNPSTFKWMMQNPQFRNQLQEMLNNMTEDGSWKSGQMADVLKNFNPNNQELKQQFEQIGLSPEEVMSKMVANPEIAMAFQNPKIQAALFDCSQNPANIAKYQNDKEIMDVFNKIAELFPIKGF